MQIKALLPGVILCLFLVIAITGCGDHGHSHDDGHSHEPVNQEANTTNPFNHKTID